MSIDINGMMDPGMGFEATPSSFGLGGGMHVPMMSTAPEADSNDVMEEKDPRGKTVWCDEPTFDDQYEKYPSSCRLLGPQIAVFNIAEASQLHDLNKLLLTQQPKEAPGIVLINKKENFFQGSWLMSVEYFKVQYKKLISTN
jgi:hypothetical protein